LLLPVEIVATRRRRGLLGSCVHNSPAYKLPVFIGSPGLHGLVYDEELLEIACPRIVPWKRRIGAEIDFEDFRNNECITDLGINEQLPVEQLHDLGTFAAELGVAPTDHFVKGISCQYGVASRIGQYLVPIIDFRQIFEIVHPILCEDILNGLLIDIILSPGRGGESDYQQRQECMS